MDFIRPTGGLHKALYTRDSELMYLRNIAQFAVVNLGDLSRLAGTGKQQMSAESGGLPLASDYTKNLKFFLRELIVLSLFLPIMDTLADPDVINKLLILFFDPEPMRIFEEKSEQVEILERLTVFSPNQAPDSLLQVSIENIVEVILAGEYVKRFVYYPWELYIY